MQIVGYNIFSEAKFLLKSLAMVGAVLLILAESKSFTTKHTVFDLPTLGKEGGVSMRQPRQKLSSTTLGLNKHRTAVKINKHKKTRISKVPRSISDNFYGVKISKYKQLWKKEFHY